MPDSSGIRSRSLPKSNISPRAAMVQMTISPSINVTARPERNARSAFTAQVLQNEPHHELRAPVSPPLAKCVDKRPQQGRQFHHDAGVQWQGAAFAWM